MPESWFMHVGAYTHSYEHGYAHAYTHAETHDYAYDDLRTGRQPHVPERVCGSKCLELAAAVAQLSGLS